MASIAVDSWKNRMHMHKLLILFAILAILLVGCVPTDDVTTSEPADVKPLYLPVEVIGCFVAASHIEYVPDKPGHDVWQSPRETIERQKGDCEDLAIYLQSLLKRQGVESEVILGLKNSTLKHGHAWCEFEFDGEAIIVEPGVGGIYRRKTLPRCLYIPAVDIDVVTEKVKAYHERTGVYVNSAYKKIIEEKSTK